MSKDPKINALLSLLQDDNPKVAALAMEQFLKLDTIAEETIAENQDAPDPHLRQRIHQMTSIQGRRRLRRDFLHKVEVSGMSIWEGLRRINRIYDPRCNLEKISRQKRALRREAEGGLSTAGRVAAFMREQDFTVPDETILEVDLYLVESVLEFRFGSSIILCALARQLGRSCGSWESTISLYEGRFCLVDKQNMVMDPAKGWEITRLSPARNLHPCSRQDVWMGVLSQLFLIGLVEGSLRDLHLFGDLLTALSGDDLDSLPYPMGDRQ